MGQREGMGLLERQAIPFLRYVVLDGWMCTFIIKQQLEIPLARSWAAPVRATERLWKSLAEWAIHHIKKSHLSGYAVLTSPLAFGLIGLRC